VKVELIGRVRASQAAEQTVWTSETHGPDTDGGAALRTKASGSWWNWVLVTAAVMLALLSFGLSWQNRRITAELAKERKAAESLIVDRVRIEQLVGTLTAPDTLTVRLTGSGETARATGTVKFNSKSGVVLYSANLPALPPDKSYQMWLVPASGAPISAGLLGPGGHAWGNLWTAQVPANTEAKAFAVTIEPVGGMPQPTGPKVLTGTT
jgi:anti-sigma-K factor RskA